MSSSNATPRKNKKANEQPPQFVVALLSHCLIFMCCLWEGVLITPTQTHTLCALQFRTGDASSFTSGICPHIPTRFATRVEFLVVSTPLKFPWLRGTRENVHISGDPTRVKRLYFRDAACRFSLWSRHAMPHFANMCCCHSSAQFDKNHFGGKWDAGTGQRARDRGSGDF